VKGRIYVAQQTREEDLYLDASAMYHSKKSLSFSSFFKLQEVKAATINFQDGKYVENKVTNFIEKDELSDAFYDDQKSVNFILPNLKTGSKSIIETKEQIANPRFLNTIYLGNFFPVVQTKVTLEVDNGVNIEFKKFHTEDTDLTISKKEKGGKQIYTILATNIKKYDFEDDAPSAKFFIPHVVPIITSYTSGKSEVMLSENVSNLYSWYYSLIKNTNLQSPREELVKIVDSITSGKTSEVEKVRAIYYWAQNQIKYIAFEYALGGFVPRDANLVYEKKYGDCKDNSSIMSAMLNIAGIRGNITWIGTRSIPYSYEDMPTPIADNHMILTYTNDEKTYYLDATSRYHPLELPTSFIQGKEALIAIDSSNYVIKIVPIASADKNRWIDDATFTIQDNQIEGTAKTTMTGYQKIDAFYMLESKTTDDKLKTYYTQIFQKGNNKFSLSNIQELNKFSYDNNFEITYDFKIADYISGYDNELYINMNFAKYTNIFNFRKDRKTDAEFKYKNLNEFNYTFIVPEGYEVTYLPEDITVENEWLQAAISYKKEGDKIHYTHTVKQDFIDLTVAQLEELNQLKTKIEKAYKEVIVIKKIIK
ncbi:MAG: transglutaminase, partial [Bacteroidetes bacterium HGW-Bacteroidetes-23]